MPAETHCDLICITLSLVAFTQPLQHLWTVMTHGDYWEGGSGPLGYQAPGMHLGLSRIPQGRLESSQLLFG